MSWQIISTSWTVVELWLGIVCRGNLCTYVEDR